MAFHHKLEAAAVDVVASVAPWLAPLPTMWLVWERTVTHLGWPGWVGFVAGLTLELLGLAILATCLMLYNYNRGKRKIDPDANMVLPWVLVGLYFLSAELLTVLLDTAPKLAREQVTTVADWAPAVFPVLSVAGFALLALRADHKRRVDAIRDAKEWARLQRKERVTQQNAPTLQQDATPIFTTKKEHVIWLHERNPDWSRLQLAQAAGCSISTVSRALCLTSPA